MARRSSSTPGVGNRLICINIMVFCTYFIFQIIPEVKMNTLSLRMVGILELASHASHKAILVELYILMGSSIVCKPFCVPRCKTNLDIS